MELGHINMNPLVSSRAGHTVRLEDILRKHLQPYT